MKHFLAKCALTVSFLILPLMPFQPTSQPGSSAHHIGLQNVFGELRCSSIAVGPHTLLTAAHCALGTSSLTVDGNKVTIASTLYDEQDHMLLVLDGAPFPATVEIEQREPKPDEHVRMWGWPGEAKSAVPREGHFIDVEEYCLAPYIWQLPAFPGDSGSGLIADNGKVIAVLSTANESAEAGTFPLSFTPKQLKEIK